MSDLPMKIQQELFIWRSIGVFVVLVSGGVFIGWMIWGMEALE